MESKDTLPCPQWASISLPEPRQQAGGPIRHSGSGAQSARALSELHLPVGTATATAWLNSGSSCPSRLPQDGCDPEDVLLPKPKPGGGEQAARSAPTPGGRDVRQTDITSALGRTPVPKPRSSSKRTDWRAADHTQHCLPAHTSPRRVRIRTKACTAPTGSLAPVLTRGPPSVVPEAGRAGAAQSWK